MLCPMLICGHNILFCNFAESLEGVAENSCSPQTGYYDFT